MSALKNDCQIIVLESAKNEYTPWAIENSIKYYAPADPKRDQIRFPIFELKVIREGDVYKTVVPIIEHIGGLWNVISAAFPLEGPMIPLLKRALYEVYEYCGWSIIGKDANFYLENGEPVFPNIQDLCLILAELINELGYSGELRSNIEAALVNRLKDLSVGSRKIIFSDNSGYFSILDIIDGKSSLDKSGVICLDHLESEEDKALALGLFLLRLRESARLEGILHNSLRKVIVLEEAHRIIPNIKTGSNIDPSIGRTKEESVTAFNDAITEMRSYGIGFIIVDQSPSKVSIDVLRNIGTKVIHSVQENDDRQAACSILGEDPDIGNFLVGMDRGFSLVHSRGMTKSALVKVFEYKSIEVTEPSSKSFELSSTEQSILTPQEIITSLIVELISGTVESSASSSIEWRRKLSFNYKEYGIEKTTKNLSNWSKIVDGSGASGLSDECILCPLRCKIPLLSTLLLLLHDSPSNIPNQINAYQTSLNFLNLIEIHNAKSINNFSNLRQYSIYFVKDIILNDFSTSGKILKRSLSGGLEEKIITAFEKCIALHSNKNRKLYGFVQGISKKPSRTPIVINRSNNLLPLLISKFDLSQSRQNNISENLIDILIKISKSNRIFYWSFVSLLLSLILFILISILI